MTEWGHTIYKITKSGKNAGQKKVKRLRKMEGTLVCMTQGPNYVDNTRSREPLTDAQLDRLIRRKYET